ncbi:EAL domain-containing protein [Desertifilum sp. FACHB-1129]|nr:MULTISPECIES: EAL domain-containing protein [Desertifilum]MBD2313506.1 EAL domain-containing protein [Desertifilum sp. FACHB-1129]MBD2323838.1 EAL domain-containing protein [Desertifilum sp. FACHB-866]MBD2333683.1 EAL domain-containing protein [Desertifilum sp. FACHB-868]MDA0211446.1 EAL domain-containing protein [Cyanobacteria bacterium FC1]
MNSDRLLSQRLIGNVILVYALASSFWIAATDRLLEWTVQDMQVLLQFQTIKGWVFVFVSCLLFYYLLNYSFRKLKSQSDLLETLLEGTSDLIFIKDSQGRYLLVNSALAKRLNLSPEEIIGKRDTDLFPPEVVQALRENDLQVIDTGQAICYEEEIYIAGKRYFDLATKSAYRNLKGQVIGIIGIVHDITERQQIKQTLIERERFLSTLVNNFPGMVYRCQSESNLTLEFASIGCYELTGYSPEDFAASGAIALLDIVHPDDRAFRQAAVAAAIQTRSPFTVTYRIVTAQGEEKWVWDRGVGVYNSDELAGIEGFMTDISDRHHLLEALTREKEDLAALSHVTANTIGILDLEELLRTLLERTLEVMKADRAVILLKEGDELSIRDSVGFTEEMPKSFRLPIGQGFSGTIAATGQPLYLADAQASSLVQSPFIKRSGIRTMLGVPLQQHDSRSDPCGNRLVGVLHVDWFSLHPQSDRELHLLQVTAERCTTAILNAQLYEQTKHLQELFQLQFNCMPAMCVLRNEQMQVIDWNPTAAQVFGYSKEEVMGRTSDFYIFPDARDRVNNLLQRVIEQGETLHSINQNLTKSGQTIICEWINTPLKTPDGRVMGMVSMGQDITQRVQTEALLRESEERLRTVLQNMPVMMSAFDNQGTLIVWNRECERVTGYLASEIVGNPNALELLYPNPEYRAEIRAQWQNSNHHYRDWECQITCKDGNLKIVAWSSIASDFPIPNWAFWDIGVDVTHRKQIEDQLRYSAYYDALTGLPNRTFFLEQLQHAINKQQTEERELFAVLFLDLDRFEMVKYTFGHAIANQLLRLATERLRECLSPTDILSRVGTDQFAILLNPVENTTEVTHRTECIHQAISLPFHLNNQDIFSSVSIGIALSSTGYTHPEDYLQAADSAMHQAKTSYSTRHVLFDPKIHEILLARLQMETELRRAIEQDAFEVYYQPIVCLQAGIISGFEALVRWNHPTWGRVSPVEFIPVAEEARLISLIDRWVLQAACHQLRKWQQDFPHLDYLTMSVNISGQQLMQLGLLERLDGVLQETGISGNQLKLEITESAIMENTASETVLLNQLRTLGIQLSIDDFGTGYSSLGRLHQLPIDTLKIDRSFVNRMETDSEGYEIVRAILTLAHSLEMDAIAEGIETSQQLVQLRELGCNYGQGYFFSPPMNSTEAAALLAANRRW